jgi:mRNA degradation ribonuclease J1/J2
MHGVSDAAAAARDLPVELVPLGGLGEFGLNMMAVSCGDTTILIDAGAMFPDSDCRASTSSCLTSRIWTPAAGRSGPSC